MQRRRTTRDPERGVVILLVALVLLFIVAALAALAIDLVTFYTARSEAQLAADSIALAGARVLANSGMTSDPTDTNLRDGAEVLACNIALQEASQNQVGGRNLLTGPCPGTAEVGVSFNDSDPTFGTNPHVIAQVTRKDLPTFFARIWGRTQITVSASAIAEAYNPSFNASAASAVRSPVAPSCVKPWLLPNISPADGTSEIFDPTTGTIQNPLTLLGWNEKSSNPPIFKAACTGNGCINNWPTPSAWKYYPGVTSGTTPSFPPPTQALPSCSGQFTPYQDAIAGCVATPIACNQQVDLDTSNYAGRNRETAEAVNCLTHCENGQGNPPPGDQVTVFPPNQSFQFLGGAENPIVGAVGKNLLVSNSLVTVPVYNSNSSAPPTSVQVIGFVQLFLNWDGEAAPVTPGARLRTTIVNLAGCGTNLTGQPILGNGASPVAVRLISR